ncbi:multiheme c-type cytochrome [Rubripirellula amarantea]|nr:multiheme c-type cytochrome [Rubripirellula amarantea]
MTALCAVCSFMSLVGCAPPASFPSQSDGQLSDFQTAQLDPLDPPSERSTDESRHYLTSIAPPSLSETSVSALNGLETSPTITLRLGDATTLVQTASGSEDVPSGVEIIPTPPGERDPAMTPQAPPSSPKPATPVPATPVPATPAPATPKPAETKPASPTPAKSTPMDSASAASPKPGAPAAPEAKMADASEAQPKPVNAPPKAGTDSIGGPEDYTTWTKPLVSMVFTGNQHGYIEPCGCTGLDRQKGGVARRFTFLDSLRQRGWDVIPMDAGNQVRRVGNQAKIKLQQSARALSEMGYQAVGFGPDDIRQGATDLLSIAYADSPEEAVFISANVLVLDPEFVARTKLIEQNGLKIGVTSITDPESLLAQTNEDITVGDMAASAKSAIDEMEPQSPDFSVLLFFGKEEAAEALVREVTGFDLVVVAGGFGEPTYQAKPIQDSDTRIIVTGDKGMYAGVVGLFGRQGAENGKLEMKYARVPLTHEFKDAPAMRGLMKDYQNQLRDIGLEGLGLLPPIPHSSGRKFVGTQTCAKCHTSAYEVWEGSAHAHATESIVKPSQDRGDVARHFDPECLSCHVTGWNPQEYHPYESGYLSLESTPHLTANGCENCHGPGAEHSAAEEGSGVSDEVRAQLRLAIQLPLEKAREKCMSCHDLDNSPDFHEPDAFEDVYWPEVEHYGLD